MCHFSYCVLECVDPSTCPPGSKYADIIQFRSVALPGGIPARQDLIRLTAYNQHDEVRMTLRKECRLRSSVVVVVFVVF